MIISKSLSKLLLITYILLLCGCQLDYPATHQGQLLTQKAMVPKDFSALNQQQQVAAISALNFTEFNSNDLFRFRDLDQDILLKVTAVKFTDAVNEATLYLQPKYLKEVSYANYSNITGLSNWRSQYRNKSDQNRYFSSENFAFNLDKTELNNTHYLLVKSSNDLYLALNLVDTNSYIKSDAQFSSFLTVVYSIILALILFNTIFYLFNRDTSYLLYIIYLSTTLYALLWQEGKINLLPSIAFYLLGDSSSMIYIMIADLAAIAFFYHFMHLSFKQGWLVRLVILAVIFKAFLIIFALLQHHAFQSLNYDFISRMFNLSVIINSIVIWVILLVKTWQSYPQAKYLFIAWSILIVTVFLRIYYILNPFPELLWMPHSYEVGIMLDGLILAFAMADRTMTFKKERDVAIDKYTAAERSAFEHQLITDFQTETQEIAKNPTLSKKEALEKINIKFHLLINKAFPVENSMIKNEQGLTIICANALTEHDFPIIKKEVFDTQDQHHQVKDFEILNSKNLTKRFLLVPLNQTEGVALIFGLKNNNSISQELIAGLQSYADTGYAAMTQAFKTHEVALSANLDSLTQIHNRGSIEQVIDDSLKTAKRTSLAYIDLDDLKKINDQYGHHIGDQCIIELVDVLSQGIENLAKLGRIGGDEFIVVYSDIEFERCEETLLKLIDVINQMCFSESELTLTVSVGLAESRINETRASLLKKADTALYHAKYQGKNQLVVFEPSLISD